MREAASTLDATIRTLQCPMQASFVALPGKTSAEGRPMRYLCFAQCDNEELIRDALAVGESGQLSFYPPKDNKIPVGWKYTIRPPLPKYEYTGNLIFQVRRPGNDERDIITSSKPQLEMHQIEVWANPEASDVSARRLIKCVNDIKEAGEGADELRRYTLAKDLADVDDGKTHDSFHNPSKEQKEQTNF